MQYRTEKLKLICFARFKEQKLSIEKEFKPPKLTLFCKPRLEISFGISG